MTDEVKIKITSASHGSQIFVNGTELKNVRRIEVIAGVDEPSRVIVSIIAAEVDIEGESFVFNSADDPNQGKLDI